MNIRALKSKSRLIGIAVIGIAVLASLLMLINPTELPEGFVFANGRTESIEVDIPKAIEI